jgi:hypothetical protein
VRPTAILYGKPGCHLCDLAEAILDRLAQNGEVEWTKQDIEADSALFERYRYEIPVIKLEDGTELHWPTTPERVRRALRSVHISR